jgi:hypothetical protein
MSPSELYKIADEVSFELFKMTGCTLPGLLICYAREEYADFLVRFKDSELKLKVSHNLKISLLGPPDNRMVNQFGYNGVKCFDTVEDVYQELVRMHGLLSQAAQELKAAQKAKAAQEAKAAKAVRAAKIAARELKFCKKDGCTNALAWSRLCLKNEYCRPCQRKEEFKCCYCGGVYPGEPEDSWGPGRPLCKACVYETPPPSDDDDY